MKNWSIERLALTGLGIAFGVFASLALVGWHYMQKTQEASVSIDLVQETLITLERMISDMQGAEAARFGYLVSGTAHYLTSNRDDTLAVKESLRKVVQLTEGNAKQQERLTQIKQLINRQDEVFYYNQNLRKNGWDKPNPAAFNLGASVSTEIHHIMDQLIATENSRLRERTTKKVFQLNGYRTAFMLSQGAMAALLAYIFLTIRTRHGSILFVRVDQAVRESEQRYRLIVETANDGICILEHDGVINFLNARLAGMLGYQVGECLGHSIFEFIDSSLIEQVKRRLDRRKEVIGETYDLLFKHRDGTDVCVIVGSQPIRGQNGEFLSTLATITDITARKKIEKALQESEFLWKFALEGAGDGVWDWNNQTRQVTYSRRWKEMLGYDEHEIENSFEGWERLIHPMDKSAALLAFNDYIEGKTGQYHQEYRLRCKDGHWKWLLSRGAVVERDADGKPLRTVGVHSDISASKQAEQVKVHLMLEAAPDPMFLIADDGMIQYANQVSCKVFGYPTSDLIGMEIETLVPFALRGKHLHLRAAFKQGGKPHAMAANREINGQKRDGAVFPAEISLGLLKMDGGNFVIANVRDVSQRKLAEAQSKRLALVAQKTTTSVIITDADGRIEWVNSAFCKMTGYGFSEVVGRKPGEFFPPPNADPASLGMMCHCMAARTACEIDAVNYKKDGTPYWLNSKMDPVFDGDHRLEYFIAVQNDISDRKETEAELFASRERLESIFNAVSDGVVVLAKDGLVESNPAAQRILGLSQPQMATIKSMASLQAALHMVNEDGDAFGPVENPLLVSLRTGEALRNVIIRINKPDGTLAWIAVNTEPLRDANGAAYMVVGSFTDISERKRATETLQQTLGQLRRLTDHQENIKEIERKRIARDIHDDLGQNLLALKLDVSTLYTRTVISHPRLNARVGMVLENIDATIKSVRAIINDLRPATLELGLYPAVEWQLKQFQQVSGIACTMVALEEEFQSGLSDELISATFRILQESLSNIARHAQATEVNIALSHQDGQLQMQVRDNGIGIQPPDRRKENSFGLIGIKERIIALGGELLIDSTQDNGTTLTMTMPLGGVRRGPAAGVATPV